MNLFETVKTAVHPRMAAERYGLPIQPCWIGSPYRSAAMRGVTAAFTVSNRFIGNFSFQIF